MWTANEQIEHRELWAKALTERQFPIGHRALRGYSPEGAVNDQCRCVLGVACEVYQQATGHGWWVPIDDVRDDIESVAGASVEFTMPTAGDSPHLKRYVPCPVMSKWVLDRLDLWFPRRK